MFDKLIEDIIAKRLDVHGVEVFHGGKVTERHMFGEDKRYPVYSATKSFISAAAGILWDEGKLDLNRDLAHYLTSEQMKYAGSGSSKVLAYRIPRFLTMSAGNCPFRPEGENWLEYSISLPYDSLTYDPEFHYSNIPAYLMGVALENIAGEHLGSFLGRRLFKPLGIDSPTYKNCPSGHFYGASGMELTLHELSLLGQLFMQGGVFGGKRIISEEWTKMATSKQIENKKGGYGYYFWVDGDRWYISGKWGQKCIVCPRKALMVTALADLPERAEELSDLLNNFIDQY